MEDLVDGGTDPLETLPPTAVIAMAFSPPAPPATDDGAPPTPTTVDGAPTSPKPTSEGVEDQGKLTRVAAFPIGIDSERFIRALEVPQVHEVTRDGPYMQDEDFFALLRDPKYSQGN